MSEVVYSIEDLSKITGLSRRTIRFYIQEELLAKPEGQKRGAHYLASHLETLLRVRRLSAEGMTLDSIRQTLRKHENKTQTTVISPKSGTTRTCVHIAVAPGVELTVDPSTAQMNSQELRELVKRLVEALGGDSSPTNISK